MSAESANNEMPASPKTTFAVSSVDDDRLSRPSSLSSPRQPVKQVGPLECQDLNIVPQITVSKTPPTAVPHQTGQASSPFNASKKVLNDSGTLKLNLKWKVTAENPIYEDEPEKISSIGTHRLPSNQESKFWRYPVRYIEYLEKNLFRTVMIDYIPLGTTYSDVLDNIYGGAIEKIELFEPIGTATNYMTARLVFHYELAASMTATYARDHQMMIRGKPVRVWQVITQTYPKNRRLEVDVFENMYTRLLLANLKNASSPEEVKNEMRAMLPVKLEHLKSSIVEISKTGDGFDLIEFTSVAAATSAMEQLRRDPDFGGIEMDFEDDPCAEPYPFGG